MGAEARLAELKLELPPAPKPVATYVTAVRHGDLLYVSGHGPLRSDGTLHTGRLGADLDVAAGHGRRAADRPGDPGDRPAATSARSTRSSGSSRCSGWSTARPTSRPAQGHQRLLRPDGRGLRRAGKGARSAVGMGSLPGGIAVEIEAIFQVKD